MLAQIVSSNVRAYSKLACFVCNLVSIGVLILIYICYKINERILPFEAYLRCLCLIKLFGEQEVGGMI